MWIESILAEFKSVPVTVEGDAEPDEEQGSKEHVVGIADSGLRRAFCLVSEYRRRTMRAAADTEVGNAKAREEKKNEAAWFYAQAGLLSEIFWLSCRAAFPELRDKASIGIRKGWKVIWSEADESRAKISGVVIGVGDLANALRGATSEEVSDTTPDKSHLH
jgi:hypothetical protein